MQTDPGSRRSLLLWMVLAQLLVLALVYPLIYAIGQLFVATSGTRPTDPWYFLLTAAPCPGAGILLSVVAWLAYGRGQYRRAALLSGFAVAVPAGLLLLIWIGLYWSGAT